MTPRGELYRAYGHLIDLCDNKHDTLVKCVKLAGDIIGFIPYFTDHPTDYTLACGIIEGVPVFDGQIVYNKITGETVTLCIAPNTFIATPELYTLNKIVFKENELVAVRDDNKVNDNWVYRHYHDKGLKSSHYYTHSMAYNPLTQQDSHVKVPWAYCRKLTTDEKETLLNTLGLN
jgi:hypothetical protein